MTVIFDEDEIVLNATFKFDRVRLYIDGQEYLIEEEIEQFNYIIDIEI